MNQEFTKKVILQPNGHITEHYTYTRNQPKDVKSIVLQPTIEGYNYATYKPAHRNVSAQEEGKSWVGVL